MGSVVPHTGDVDRNPTCAAATGMTAVVPHTGDVDRNPYLPRSKCAYIVVPHTGDVDRNCTGRYCRRAPFRRPPYGGRG